MSVCMLTCVHMYMYMYVYERERKRYVYTILVHVQRLIITFNFMNYALQHVSLEFVLMNLHKNLEFTMQRYMYINTQCAYNIRT